MPGRIGELILDHVGRLGSQVMVQAGYLLDVTITSNSGEELSAVLNQLRQNLY